MPADQPPAGFRSALMGQGRLGDWKIVEAEVPPELGVATDKARIPRQNVLAQLARDPTDNHYPLLILDDAEYADFTLTTRFKLVAGVVEQMAGIAFRMQNDSNYFYIRVSGLYNTIRFFQVADGQILANNAGVNYQIEKDAWHELKIQAKGNKFDFWFNGKTVLPQLTDDNFPAGKIAFWTKSDSVVYFANTHIHYRPRESLGSILVRELKGKNPRVQSMRIVAPQEDGALKIIASDRPEEIGQPANQFETAVMKEDKRYVGRDKEKKIMIATLPIHDKNGEVAGTVRFEMDPFPGQTEKNVLERAGPIVKEMEKRLAASEELTGLQ